MRDPIHLGRRVLRALGKRDDDADQPPVLIVEDVSRHDDPRVLSSRR